LSVVDAPAAFDASSRRGKSGRGVANPELAQLIRAALAASGLVDPSTDEELTALVAAQFERRGGTDLATAVGAALLERHAALRASSREVGRVASSPEVDAPTPQRSPAEGGGADRGGRSSHTMVVPDLERSKNGTATPAAVIPSGTLLRLKPVASVDQNRRRTKAASRQRAPGRRSFAAVMFSWIRNIGLIMLLFVAWQLWGTGLSEHHAQSAFASQFVRQTSAARSHSPAVTSPRLISTAPQAAPSVGTLVARLQVPAISLSQYVVEGTTESDLGEGPGHYVGTALPGYTGNVAIAGHRTTYGAPFNRLGQVVPGDLIYLTTMSGERFTYRVVHPPVAVAPSDVAVLDDFGDDRVTLTTCNPEFSASQRLVVVGIYVAPKVAPTTSTPAVALNATASPTTTPAASSTPKVAGSTRGVATTALTPVGWNFAKLPKALLFAAVLVGLGLAYNRIFRRFGWAAWIVLAPAWIYVLVLFFGAIDAVSPTTF
jgi:sortase A